MTLEEAMAIVKPGQKFHNKINPAFVYAFGQEIDAATINVNISMSDHNAQLPYRKTSCAEFFESGAWVAQ